MRSLIDTQSPVTKRPGHTGHSVKHDSAHKHVAGNAFYIDDMAEPRGLLHTAVGFSTIAKGRITAMNLDKVKQAPGVVKVITVEDVPGHTDIGPVFKGDPILTSDEIKYAGQPIFAVAATSYELARKAVRLAEIEYEQHTPMLDAEQALAEESFVRDTPTPQTRGDVAAAIASADHQLTAKQYVGAQEHFYLEGQIAMVAPAEDGGLSVWSSTQHPSEVQKLVAEVLNQPISRIVVDTRRMGGGFGGKETQAAPWACIAAVLCYHTGKPVKCRLARQDDMTMTGKRHDFFNQYHIGFDKDGMLAGADITVNGICGHSPDLSDAIVDRAMFHSDNAYYLPTAKVVGNRLKTNTVSHTAFRGFGGPQGMMIIERAMDDIARVVGKDPLDVRLQNLYRPGADKTHYDQTVETETLPLLLNQLIESSEYRLRREEISAFNQQSPILKKGLALTPVKFGISFTAQHLNQAGALIHVYTDGSIQVNHGGTEMGQGLNTKVAQIVAEEFQVHIDTITLTATRTDKVPNTSPTAASSGTDLNGKAAQAAAQIIKQRLIDFLMEKHAVAADDIQFADSHVHVKTAEGTLSVSFPDLCQQAYFARVSLSSTGFYKTPKIWYDRDNAKGRPFFYYANGASVSEVIVDTLTGEYRVLRADLLHDVGRSLNPDIDKGQIEGGFIQGMGWMTTEEVKFSDNGRLMSNNPATYKIPAIGDTPPIFNVNLLQDSPNKEATIYRSKAVGEPPFMLGMSVWSALRDAISSLSNYTISPDLDTPATPERVLFACQQVRAESAGA